MVMQIWSEDADTNDKMYDQTLQFLDFIYVLDFTGRIPGPSYPV